MDLKDKRVVVTGGGTGIGRGVALGFAAEGSHVAICGRRKEPLAETVSLHTGENPVLTKTCDVADRDSTGEFFSWVEETLGGIDIIVINAGINVRERSMAETTPEDWDRVLSVNATGPFNCMHAVLPGMRERQDGLIVNICSTAGKRPIPLGGIAYGASKFAQRALGIGAGYEEGDNGIRITNVYPGEVDTPILDNRPQKVSDEHKARILQPEDVAAMVVAVAKLPARASVPELIVKPTIQLYA